MAFPVAILRGLFRIQRKRRDYSGDDLAILRSGVNLRLSKRDQSAVRATGGGSAARPLFAPSAAERAGGCDTGQGGTRCPAQSVYVQGTELRARGRAPSSPDRAKLTLNLLAGPVALRESCSKAMLVNAEKIFLNSVDRIRRDPAAYVGTRARIDRQEAHQSRHPTAWEGEFRTVKNGILQ